MSTLRAIVGRETSDFSQIQKEDALYPQFRPEPVPGSMESVEWSMCYSYDTTDLTSPRLLLIGHSIEQSIHGHLRAALAGRMTLSFWAGSKCVTHRDYFRELSLILNQARADVICFANGSHRLEETNDTYEIALRQALAFIRAVKPQAKLFLLPSTPCRVERINAPCVARNKILAAVGAELGIPYIDTYTYMDSFDLTQYWFDEAHFKPNGQKLLADFIAGKVQEECRFADTGKKLTVKPGQSDYDRNQQILDDAVIQYCEEKEK